MQEDKTNNNQSLLENLEQLCQVIERTQAKKIVLQVTKSKLNECFALTQKLKERFKSHDKNQNGINFFTLYDSMKNECCVDVLGGRHVGYDLLVHFGEACFSQKYDPRHYYFFDRDQKPKCQRIGQKMRDSIEKIEELGVQNIVCQQGLYYAVRDYLKKQNHKLYENLCRFNFDRLQTQKDEQKWEYLSFGYYRKKASSLKNLLIICRQDNAQNKLLSNFYMTKDTLGIQKIFVLTPEKEVHQAQLNLNTRMMQRMSLASQLQKHERFGICVSNPSTQFCQIAIEYCKRILKKHNKKVFLFMMSMYFYNLNEAKLGNFPEIQVYVVVSCYNYSLYSKKEFFRLVVSPFDLQLGLEERGITEYCFDLRNWRVKNEVQVTHDQKSIQKNYENSADTHLKNLCPCGKDTSDCGKKHQLQKVKNEVILASSIQTLDYYRLRQYKGLQFSQKKQVVKMKKGKVGLAEQYQPLEEDDQSTK